jgi:hypothetical protein
MSPDLRTFVDRVIVPALVERFLRDQNAGQPSIIVNRDPRTDRESARALWTGQGGAILLSLLWGLAIVAGVYLAALASPQ